MAIGASTRRAAVLVIASAKEGRYGAVAYTHRRDMRLKDRPVTAPAQIACCPDSVKSYLLAMFENAVSDLLVDDTMTPREMEQAVWRLVVVFGRELLTMLLTMACLRATAKQTEGSTPRLRLDDDYTISQTTTFGTVQVPLFAYRDDAGRTHAPAKQEVFPLHPKCRSSELCLEWESRLGSQLPFRQAEDAMDFFSHGAVRVEDTTIARHMGIIGELVTREWTYRTPEDITRILDKSATRDRKTGKAILYASTDAHAMRRYEDETWEAPWKMLNGVRLWCEDRVHGGIIHLGGEYTWGDCREVGERFETLVSELGELEAQWVFISDGMPWFRDHVIPKLPEDTTLILDFYHAMERLGEYASERFGSGSKRAAAFLRRVQTVLTGKRPYRRAKAKKRKGHRKNRGRRDRFRTVHASTHPCGAAEDLLRRLAEWADGSPKGLEAIVGYIAENSDRMDYPAYRKRGFQIGSGAMESLHRVASQMRLKLAGARWLPERAIAVLNFRLMLLAERWDAFWGHDARASTLREAFTPTPVPTA